MSDVRKRPAKAAGTEPSPSDTDAASTRLSHKSSGNNNSGSSKLTYFILGIVTVLLPLYSMRQSLCDRATSPTPPERVRLDQDGEDWARFIRWLDTQGATFNGVSSVSMNPEETGGGRGLFATKDLENDEMLVSVPQHCWMTEKSALNSVIGALIVDSNLQNVVSGYWSLVMSVAYERELQDSAWGPYIKVLPDPTSALFFTQAELNELQSDNVVSQIAGIKNDVDEFYNQLFPYLFKTYPKMFFPTVHTRERFYWATASVWARSFSTTINDDDVWTMVPYADLVNDEMHAENNYRVASNRFDVHTSKTYKKGDQIFISYGSKSNLQLFLYYGFVFQNNPKDFVTFRFTTRSPEEEEESPETNPIVTRVGFETAISKEFVEDAAKKLGGSYVNVYERISKELTKIIASWPTNTRDDTMALAEDIPYNKRVAIMLRLERKKVVNTIQTKVDELIKKHKAGEITDEDLLMEPFDDEERAGDNALEDYVIRV
eukprot:GFYU01005588.1.p1 GENE.GFYU01005588.1~~GFYU01005588.1.p1  ORF type:complete len:489 (+),score=159.93 GFYU01005588.1:144-1610(+)